MIDRLKKFEDLNRFVFHGSSVFPINELEPRQSYSFGEPDGQPAISASNSIWPAIFMSILSRESGCAMGINISDKNPFGLLVPESVYEKAHIEKWIGYVYVLEATEFVLRKHGSFELRSTVPAKPVDVLPVQVNDLPKGINVVSDNERDSYVNKYR
ncbi:MAG: hypothetical protein ACR2FM_03320 [Candidatus Saccharimonadales bacterium]